MNALDATSTRPYLIRALYEWCTDNGLTPYIAVMVDETVQVPRDYVKNNEIVLNIGFDATSSLKLGNEFIEFKARFAGSAREIVVPVGRVIAIYARENGQGMSFPGPAPSEQSSTPTGTALVATAPAATPAASGGDGNVMQLVPDAAPSRARGKTPEEPPEPPKSPPGKRPSLKRVK